VDKTFLVSQPTGNIMVYQWGDCVDACFQH